MKNLLATSVAALSLGMPQAALSQTSTAAESAAASQGAAASGDNSVGVGDIVVTAQRRSERLQDVPVAVTALSAAPLQAANIGGTMELGQVVPSLNIERGSNTVLPYLRGVGSAIAAAGNEASTAIYVDGVYYARLQPYMLQFNNIERVEVLKGPQGTLFGRNSSGGLIQIVTKEPSRDQVFQAKIGYANYDTFSGDLYVSGSVADGVATSLSVVGYRQGDGWGKNLTNGDDVNYERYFAVRSKTLFEIGDRTKITLSADYGRANSTAGLPGIAAAGTTQGLPTGGNAILPPPAGFFDLRSETTSYDHSVAYGGYLRIEHEADFATLVSLSAYRHLRSNLLLDADYTAVPFFNALLRNEANQKSQEFQIISNDSSPFSWIVGTYYLDSKDGYDPATLSGISQGGAETLIYGKQRVKSYSGYAQATVEVLPKLSITGGLRYTKDDVKVVGRIDARLPGGTAFNAVPAQAFSTSFKKLTYKAAIDYKFTDDIMAYGSISRGFKSGTYTTLPVDGIAAKPEVIDAYEIGLKTTLFDRRLRLNFAAFHYDVSNLQVIVLRGLTSQQTNAGSARIRGFEVEAEAALTSQFSARFSAGYLDGKYKEFPDAPITTQNDQLVGGLVPGCTTPATQNIDPANGGNVELCAANLAGNRLAHAPKLTMTGGLSYNVPLSEGSLTFNVNGSYNSGFFWHPDSFVKQKRYALLDGNVAWTSPDDVWTITVWGKNLTNTHYYSSVNELAGPGGYPSGANAPRTYGVSAKVSF